MDEITFFTEEKNPDDDWLDEVGIEYRLWYNGQIAYYDREKVKRGMKKHEKSIY
jgi:hypothetical protein